MYVYFYIAYSKYKTGTRGLLFLRPNTTTFTRLVHQLDEEETHEVEQNNDNDSSEGLWMKIEDQHPSSQERKKSVTIAALPQILEIETSLNTFKNSERRSSMRNQKIYEHLEKSLPFSYNAAGVNFYLLLGVVGKK